MSLEPWLDRFEVLETDELPHLCALAATRNQTITIFDLESTKQAPAFKGFRIIEVGMITIRPDGSIAQASRLVDPETTIDKKIRELTGISTADVRQHPTWEAWADLLDVIAREHLTAGYNSRVFDCPAVIKVNNRYGRDQTVFRNHFDIKALPGVKGSLTSAALAHGITVSGAHRALVDSWTTARIFDRVTAKLGLAAVNALIGAPPPQSSEPVQQRRDALVAGIGKSGLPNLTHFARSHGVKPRTIRSDLEVLLETKRIKLEQIADKSIQKWLDKHITAALHAAWQGQQSGRLKALRDWLALDKKKSIDYWQLRVCLLRRGFALAETAEGLRWLRQP